MSKGEVKVEVKDSTTDEVDFAKIPISEALAILQATPHGLSSAEHQKRLAEYGPNKLPESTRNPILVFLGYMWNPLAWAMEVAAIISIVLLDYADFALIVALLLANSVISYHEEANADKAIKALAAALAPKARVFRDGQLKQVEAVDLVPGDVILVAIGNVVPADIKILAEESDGSEEVPMQVDQAALTGESLPSKKFSGDVCYSGSCIKQGERHCVVYATGINTFFGRAAALIGSTNNVANLMIVMNRIGATCLGTIGLWVLIELSVQFSHYNHSCGAGEEACPTLTNMLVIIVGGIPIAMPTVLSVTLALGAANLAKEGAIVARMSAVEELAGLDILCSDKTGTLTLNKLSVETQSCLCPSGRPLPFVLKHAALSANITTEEPIDLVLASCYTDKEDLKNYKCTKYVPFNPTDKITIATIVDQRDPNVKFRVLKGSPQVVLGKAYNKSEIADSVNNKMIEFANRGFRSLGIAYAEGDGVGVESKWEMLGLVPMFDPPRHDTQATIENCHKQGIEVKMITGDHLLIGKETCRMLGMGTQMYTSETLIKAKNGDKNALCGYSNITEMVEKCNGFAEVFPEHKFEIVKILQDADHVCGMTGDGVNDAPALKKADVGIAVDGATDAARGAADIVLTQPGLSTIVTAVIGARKIFQRMTTYAKYTVSMTFRICFTFGLLTVIYDWYFPTILIVILAVFNDGAMIALAKDRVIASTVPNSWNLKNIFVMGIVYGLYLTLSSWALYQTAVKTTFFEERVGLFSLNDRNAVVEPWCETRLASPEFAPVAESIWRAFPAMPRDTSYLGNVSACALGGDEDSYFDALSKEGQCVGFGANNPAGWLPIYGTPTIMSQCVAEQKYVRGAMMRALLYNQVSISGQALVFVVRTKDWSLMNRAGTATYMAFFLAQVGSTLIAAFGFNGYAHPRYGITGGIFSCLSTGRRTPFFDNRVPIAMTESAFTASVIGCTGYVIVAWIWSGIWYMPLDLVKWGLCWMLNEDGFRSKDMHGAKKRVSAQTSKELSGVVEGPSGMVTSSVGNPLGRASLKQPISQVLDKKSASVVPVQRNSAGTGVSKVSADPSKALGIARKSLLADKAKQAPPQ